MTTDAEKAAENYAFYRYARENGHDEFLHRATDSIRFFANKQWLDSDLAVLKREGRPALTINMTFRIIDSLAGELRAGRADVRFVAGNDASDEVASILDKIYTYEMSRNKYHVLRDRVALMGLLTGRGYFDARVAFNENMRGDFDLSCLRPQNVVLDPEIDSPDPSDWSQVFIQRFANFNMIAEVYGEDVAKELELMPPSAFIAPDDTYYERSALKLMQNENTLNADKKLLKTHRLIERQFRAFKIKEFFVDTETGDMSEVPENWDRERIARVLESAPGLEVVKRKTPSIRWITTCDRFVLHEADSPYSQFTVIPFFPFFVDGYPFGPAELLLDSNRLTNKLFSQELHILNTAANSGWKLKAGSLKNMTETQFEERGAETGLVAILEDTNDLERIHPGQMPQGHDTVLRSAREFMFEVAGLTPSMLGTDSAEASKKAIDAKLARTPVNVGSLFTSMYFTDTLVAERLRDIVQTFYTETRMMRITSGATREAELITINEIGPEGELLGDVTRGEFTVMITPSPARETMEQHAFQQLSEMRTELGLNIPDEALIEYSAVPRKAELLELIRNGGSRDSEALRAKQEMEAELQALEVEAKRMDIEEAKARISLATARAERAIADAQFDARQARTELDRERLQMESERDAEMRKMQRELAQLRAAVELTKIGRQSADKILSTTERGPDNES